MKHKKQRFIIKVVGFSLRSIFFLLLPFIRIFILPLFRKRRAQALADLKDFRQKQAGNFYFIYSSKRGWHNFLINNVIPILPSNIRIIWQNEEPQDEYIELKTHLFQSGIWGLAKPYLIAVTKENLYTRSLNQDLQRLKLNAKVSEQARFSSLRIIESALEELSTNP